MKKKSGEEILSILLLMLITKIKDLCCLTGWLAVAIGKPMCVCVTVLVYVCVKYELIQSYTCKYELFYVPLSYFENFHQKPLLN